MSHPTDRNLAVALQVKFLIETFIKTLGGEGYKMGPRRKFFEKRVTKNAINTKLVNPMASFEHHRPPIQNFWGNFILPSLIFYPFAFMN